MPRKGGEETLFRLLTMLEIIPRRGKIGTVQLKEALEERGFVAELRTVQRDLKNLYDNSVFAIESDGNNPAGWKWSETSRSFDIPRMDPMAALSLTMIQQFLPMMLPKSCLAFLEPQFKQARAVLNETSLRWLKTWPKKIGFVSRSQPLLGAKVDPEILGAVTEGLLKDRKVRIKYRRKGQEVPAEGVVNPLGVVFKDHLIYLVCTYWDYKDVRHLVMHRVQEAEVLDEPMEKLEGFNLAEHIKSGVFEILEGDEKIKLKVIFYGSEEARDHPATHLRETPLSAGQRVTNLGDGKVQIEATVKDTSQLRWWLQGFGAQVEVLAPKKLRREMAEVAQNMARRYS